MILLLYKNKKELKIKQLIWVINLNKDKTAKTTFQIL